MVSEKSTHIFFWFKNQNIERSLNRCTHGIQTINNTKLQTFPPSVCLYYFSVLKSLNWRQNSRRIMHQKTQLSLRNIVTKHVLRIIMCSQAHPIMQPPWLIWARDVHVRQIINHVAIYYVLKLNWPRYCTLHNHIISQDIDGLARERR